MALRVSIGLFSILFAIGIFVFWCAFETGAQADDKEVATAKGSLIEYTPDGKAKKPVGYRKWIYIGTPVTPNDLNSGEASFPEFHNVYIDPQSFAHFEKTGEYRDGTVLVKELTSVGTKKASSGNGYFEGEFTGLEISVKDKQRFANDPGNWGYFSFGHKYPLKESVAKNEVASCNSCHEANAKDFVFSVHYPVLRAAFTSTKK
jgi:hypothetical protein